MLVGILGVEGFCFGAGKHCDRGWAFVKSQMGPVLGKYLEGRTGYGFSTICQDGDQGAYRHSFLFGN